MNQPPTAYTEFHPRWYRPRISTYWWLGRWPYVLFILRELSSVFVAWAVVYLLLLVRATARGTANYRDFLDWSANPGMLVLNLVAFAFLVLHAITWFNLAPQAMVVHMGRRRVPGLWIAASNYALWAVASIVITWIVLGG
jgi:fumarate reductase subunit C